jgi:hypothetical protein
MPSLSKLPLGLLPACTLPILIYSSQFPRRTSWPVITREASDLASKAAFKVFAQYATDRSLVISFAPSCSRSSIFNGKIGSSQKRQKSL